MRLLMSTLQLIRGDVSGSVCWGLLVKQRAVGICAHNPECRGGTHPRQQRPPDHLGGRLYMLDFQLIFSFGHSETFYCSQNSSHTPPHCYITHGVVTHSLRSWDINKAFISHSSRD